MRFKERFMGRGGNLRSNMFIYKMATDQAGEGSVVILNEDGDIGAYNRGNRSLHHFLENSLPFVASMPIVFFLYPIPAFVILCIFCVGRIAHQIGYARVGYGFTGHVPGFVLVMVATYITLGLVIVAYTKMVF